MSYTTLDPNRRHIRLLYLSPSDETDIIRCRLQIVSLDDGPEFEALSYAWGDDNNPRAIELDGQPVQVTQNLYGALKHLRLDENERTLWIDALCIDQSNDKEKNHQVALMRQIYGKASLVVVWLREGWDGSDQAMQFIQKLGDDHTLHLDPSRSPHVEALGQSLYSVELRRNIICLFDLPWWTRTWTVQEFVLARNLVFQCSKSVVTRDTMYMARQNFWSHRDGCCLPSAVDFDHSVTGSNVSSALVRPAKLDILLKNNHESFSVLTGIAMFSSRDATKPEDRVYGVLGLGTGEYADLVEPDYTLSHAKICEAVVVKSIERTRKLEFLSHLFVRDDPELPSFVPNWIGSFAWHEAYENRLGSLYHFSSSLDEPAQVDHISFGMLKARGVILDKIRSTCKTPVLQQEDKLGCLAEVRRIAGVDNHPQEVYPHTGGSRTVAMWHTLLGGMEMVLVDSDRFRKRLKGSSDLSKYSQWSNYCSKSPYYEVESRDKELYHVVLDLETASLNRLFFVTEQGFFGLGPQNCQEGDQVVVLAGGNVPYVIRRVGRFSQLLRLPRLLRQAKSFVEAFKILSKLCFGNCYIILGDSYVEGIMDGEVFLELRKAGDGMVDVVLL